MLKVYAKDPTLSRTAARDRLYQDPDFALSVDFKATLAFAIWPQQQSRYLTPYDIHSIMHYTSSTYAVMGQCRATNINGCPVAKIDGGYIDVNTQPSPTDAQAIRLLYPWKP